MRKIEEIVILLLNEESGYLEQVAGWNLSCLLAGAALADLALEYRVDTDMESLSLSDATPLGDNILDPLLKKIADDPEPRRTEYWVERIAGMSDEILEGVFERLVESGILRRASGGFWSLSRSAVSSDARVAVRRRIIETIVKPDIPLPGDAIIVGLANACDAFRFLLEPEDFEAQRDRIAQVSKLDLIGRSVAAAVAATSVRRSIGIATRPIPN
ncbi:MAG: GPP34 family phosphoprotein, partial [Thiotrichales bacterium]|nr:GPP34 family phosphoprotein [Thiotrichales bacterium]